jgi:hypothetical protein
MKSDIWQHHPVRLSAACVSGMSNSAALKSHAMAKTIMPHRLSRGVLTYPVGEFSDLVT